MMIIVSHSPDQRFTQVTPKKLDAKHLGEYPSSLAGTNAQIARASHTLCRKLMCDVHTLHLKHCDIHSLIPASGTR
jgi:hypothetical protein